ncbi:hypothetical protein D9C73_006415 [Collichthys lucidus]|uniref:Uncharacterized protein n=1 Tax=Collichthys lucidus TaxID=240159 RepID=A0A4U5UE76_COLLU|nr:hypothetical protein D9C73_006415 [Collichthys lucidus]
MPKNNVSLCNGENPTSPIQPQPADEQHERHEEECSLPPQLEVEEPDSRGAESEEEISDDATAAKRKIVCKKGNEKQKQRRVKSDVRRTKRWRAAGDEIIDVDGDVDEPEKDRCQSTTAQREKPSRSEVSLRSAGSCEEDKDNDIDVIGGSSPVPDPVTIDWTDSSEGEKRKETRMLTSSGKNKLRLIGGVFYDE